MKDGVGERNFARPSYPRSGGSVGVFTEEKEMIEN